jgi:hypothetical protein
MGTEPLARDRVGFPRGDDGVAQRPDVGETARKAENMVERCQRIAVLFGRGASVLCTFQRLLQPVQGRSHLSH